MFKCQHDMYQPKMPKLMNERNTTKKSAETEGAVQISKGRIGVIAILASQTMKAAR